MDRPGNAALITGTSDDGLIFAHPCRLERVVVGVVESGDIISFYDNAAGDTSGTKVAEISVASLGCYELGIELRVGLTAITNAGGTARVTVVWS